MRNFAHVPLIVRNIILFPLFGRAEIDSSGLRVVMVHNVGMGKIIIAIVVIVVVVLVVRWLLSRRRV